MTTLWKKSIDGTLYEVRQAGHSRRLYTNGVFHSQFSASNPITGSVWDLLLLPAFFQPQERLKRILVLGVGGGTVIRQLLHFFEPQQIIGIEICRHHIDIARRYFGVTDRSVQLIKADAIQWVNDFQGEKFDLVIEDIFSGENNDPERVIAPNQKWINQLLNLTTRQGMVVMNHARDKDFKTSAALSSVTLQKRIKCAYQLTTPTCDNIVAAYSKTPLTRKTLTDNLRKSPFTNTELSQCRLRYALKKINLK
ncbi:MAG: SAM-dependent methyltransferase [Gammaproteobacteria bacterium]|nr:MAG: SAM-dependent methyltransferase [Gammaproteobacteria bacterium]